MTASSQVRISLIIVFSLILLACGLGGNRLWAEDLQGKNIVRLNNIILDKDRKVITVKAKLALKEGILEYFLVDHQGKTYESVFKSQGNKPSEMNFALLLFGLEPLDFNKFLKLNEKESGRAELLNNHQQSLLEIEIYRDGRKVKLSELVKNREPASGPLLWVYTGGTFTRDKRFAADFELSQIAIWPDPSALINVYSNLKNPYRGEFGLEMNKENKNMEVDQDFEIIIRRFGQ